MVAALADLKFGVYDGYPLVFSTEVTIELTFAVIAVGAFSRRAAPRELAASRSDGDSVRALLGAILRVMNIELLADVAVQTRGHHLRT